MNPTMIILGFLLSLSLIFIAVIIVKKIKKIRKVFCSHDYQMSEEDEKIPFMTESGVMTREFICSKCGSSVDFKQEIV